MVDEDSDQALDGKLDELLVVGRGRHASGSAKTAWSARTRLMPCS